MKRPPLQTPAFYRELIKKSAHLIRPLTRGELLEAAYVPPNTSRFQRPPDEVNPETLLSRDDAAAILGFSGKTLLEHRLRGKIAGIWKNCRWFFAKSEVARYAKVRERQAREVALRRRKTNKKNA